MNYKYEWLTETVVIGAMVALAVALVVHKILQRKYGNAYAGNNSIKGDVQLRALPWYFWMGIAVEGLGGFVCYYCRDLSSALLGSKDRYYMFLVLGLLVLLIFKSLLPREESLRNPGSQEEPKRLPGFLSWIPGFLRGSFGCGLTALGSMLVLQSPGTGGR